MQAVVLAAGEGTRLRPLTERWPKPILPIDGRPVIATLLRELAAAGCERVYVVTGYLAEQVEELVGDGSGFALEVRYARQPGVLGSADAVQRALAAGAEPPFLVTAADTVYTAGDVAPLRRSRARGGRGARLPARARTRSAAPRCGPRRRRPRDARPRRRSRESERGRAPLDARSRCRPVSRRAAGPAVRALRRAAARDRRRTRRSPASRSARRAT